MTYRNTLLVTIAAASLMLSACAGTGHHTTSGSLASNAKIEPTFAKALADAEQAGDKQATLSILEQLHKKHKKDAAIATAYAKALREDDQINAARRVLNPFTKGKKPDGGALTELAMTQLSLGNYNDAISTAQNALKIDSKNSRAYLAIGTAQDALGQHEEAENSFRRGLKHGKDDSAPILNNLALNLASQGHLKESLSVLTKARELYPNRIEIERNYRIISTLQEEAGDPVPLPSIKPAAGGIPKRKPAVNPSTTKLDEKPQDITKKELSDKVESEINSVIKPPQKPKHSN